MGLPAALADYHSFPNLTLESLRLENEPRAAHSWMWPCPKKQPWAQGWHWCVCVCVCACVSPQQNRVCIGFMSFTLCALHSTGMLGQSCCHGCKGLCSFCLQVSVLRS